jgi:predicted dehydrogenase
VNVIIAGCGLIAGRWTRALAADARVTVTALADPDASAARRTAQQYGLGSVPVYPVLEDALAQLTGTTRPQVVVNLTPADLHAATTRAALGHGLHVLTEKPLAFTLEEALQMAALARRHGLVLGVMSNRGSDSRFLSFCKAVHDLGPGPYAVTAEMLVHLPEPGFRGRLPYPALQDLAVHAFDQARQLITAPAEAIACFESPLPHPGGHCSLASAHVRFADGSLLAFRGGFTGPGLRTAPDGHWRVELRGGQACQWDGQQTVTTTGASGRTASAHLAMTSDGHGPRITQMIDALHGGPPPPDALGSIAILDAALRSAKIAAPVTVRMERPLTGGSRRPRC